MLFTRKEPNLMKSALNSNIKSIVILLCVLALIGCGGAEQRKAKYLEQAKIYFDQGNHEKARIEVKNVLQIDPKHVEAYFLIGQIEEKRQNWEQAFANYTKVVELSPDHVGARTRLGKIYLFAGNIKNATEMMERILALQPNDVEGRFLNAAIMVRQNKSSEAISSAEK